MQSNHDVVQIPDFDPKQLLALKSGGQVDWLSTNISNPSDHTSNCSYVTLARLANQRYDWLWRQNIVEIDPKNLKNLALPQADIEKAAKKACVAINIGVAGLKLSRKADFKIASDFDPAASSNAKFLCQLLAEKWNVRSLGVAYDQHCIVYEDNQFVDYQNFEHTVVDATKVKPKFVYAITFDKI